LDPPFAGFLRTIPSKRKPNLAGSHGGFERLTEGEHLVVVPSDQPESTPPAERSLVRSAVEALDRAVPVVRRVARGIAVLALGALVGGGLLLLALATKTETESTGLAIVAVILAIPPVILLLDVMALRQLAHLPDHLATLPDRARAHASEMSRLAIHAGRARQRGWFRSAIAVFRLWRGAGQAKGLIHEAVPVAFLISPATLLMGFLAMAAALVELLLGIVSAIWLLLG
jgi:hypothetical protein